MLSSALPALVRKVGDTFKDQFEGDLAQCKNYCTLLCLFLFGLRSFSDAARSFVFSPSVSELSRAAKSFEPNRFMRRLRRSVLRKHGDLSSEDFIFAAHDSGNRRFGKTVPRSGSWGSSSGLYQGQKILLVVALVNLKTGARLFSSLAGKDLKLQLVVTGNNDLIKDCQLNTDLKVKIRYSFVR